MSLKIRRNLSVAQSELFESMQKGVVVHFVSGYDAYYFRSDTMKICTKQAFVLIDRGLVEKYDINWQGCKLRPTEPSK